MPELKVFKIYYHSAKNNKMVWQEALINKDFQYLIQATATRSELQSELSSLLSEQIVNPEDQKYELKLDFKVTMSEEAPEEKNLNQIESDRESINTASFVYNRIPFAENEDIAQQVPLFNKALGVSDSFSQNPNKSESTPGNQAQVSGERNPQGGNQLGVEARLQRMEQFLMSFAQNINLTFGNPQNQPQPLDSINKKENYSTSQGLGGEEGQMEQENINNPVYPNDIDRDIEGDFMSSSGLGADESSDFDFLQKLAKENEETAGFIERKKTPERPQLRQINSMIQPRINPKKLAKQPTESSSTLPYNYSQSPNQQNTESSGPNDLLPKHPQPAKMHHSNSLTPTRLSSELIQPRIKNQHSTLGTINEMCELRQQTDLIYLSSNPLVKLNDSGEKVSNQNLHIQKEIDEITSAVKQTNRHFNFKSQIGTSTNLTQASINGTKILHISCHGQILQSQKDSSSLLFEPSGSNNFEEQGQGCEVKPLELFDAMNYLHRSIKMVFLSACHSESVGKIFKAKGIPIVIAVNQSTKIYDEVCIVFAKYLYQKLLNGATPRIAFEQADSLVRQEKMGLFFCCCNHPHDRECPWLNGIGKTKDNPHTLHKQEGICDCKDREFQKELKGPQRQLTHSKDCKYKFHHSNKMHFLNERHNNNNLKYNQILDAKDNEDLYYACCCQTKDKPHDECSKFKFITVEDIKDQLSTEKYTEFQQRELQQMDQPIFNNYPEGTLNWIEGDYSKKDHLNQRIQEYKVFSRAKETQEIVHKVATMDKNNRLIHVHGEDGNGKSDITNYAARYALEGRVKLDAAFHIKIEQITTQEGLKAKILDEICKHQSLENSQSMSILKDFITHKYLIILDKCQSFVLTDRTSFSLILCELLQEAKEAIFIVISDCKEDLESTILGNYLTVHIDELSCRDAFKLFMNSIQDKKILQEFENQIKNDKKDNYGYEPQDHKFFTDLKRKTEKIFQSALKITANRSFKETLDDLYKGREKQEKNRKEYYAKDGSAEIMTYFNQIFKIYPIRYHKNMYVLLFLISLSPGGLFKTDLDNLFFQSHTGLGWEQFMKFLGCQDQINNTLLNTNFDNDIAINPNFLLDMEQLPGRQAQMNDLKFQLPVPLVLSKESSSISSSELLIIDNPSQLKELLIIPSRHLKNSMKHQMAAFGLKPQETCTIYEHFLSYMIQFSRKALNMNIQRIVANYSLEELNIVVDSAFLFPQQDFKWDSKKSNRHQGCSQICLKLIEEEEKVKEEQNLMLQKLHHYESNPRGILDKDFLKTHYFGPTFTQSEKNQKIALPAEKIQQLSYLFLTLLITEEKFEAADSLLINCIEIADYFQLLSFLAKLYLIQINLNLLKQSHKARKDEKKNEYLDNPKLTEINLTKIKRLWSNILSNNNQFNNDEEEEKNDGDSVSYLLQNYQDKDSSIYHEIQFGLILSGYLKIKYQTKCYLNEQKDTCLNDFDQIMRTLDEKIHLVQQKGVLINNPLKAELSSQVLISKLQLMQLEIMMHYLREANGERLEACSQLMAKSLERVDIQFLHEKGFDRFIAIFYRLKGYYKQWVADQTINKNKMQDKCMTLLKYRQANQYLTIASKYFKEVDLKDRSDKIYQSIQNNFNKLNTDEHKRIIEKNNTTLQNLICCLYSMPLIRNKKAISEIYEQDVERYLGFINKLKSLKEQERILDEIKFLPLKQDTLEMIKLHTQCSILHISTKSFDPQFLLIENNEGVGIQKSQEDLINMLINPETKKMSHIKLAVLAFPGSYQLGMTVFSDRDVEHVISFDSIAKNQDPERAFEQIDIFFWIFYEFLFNTDEPVTVTEAFHQALQSSKLKVQNFDPTMIPQLTSQVNIGKPSTLLFEKAPRLNVMGRSFEEHKLARMPPLALSKKMPHKIVGRNLEIHQVIDFILQGHSPQEKADQIMRIVGEKFIGKRSIVEAAIQYLNFRETIKIISHKLEIRAPKITNMSSFKYEFHRVLDSMYSMKMHSYENQVKIIIVFDFSDLRSEVFSKKSSKKAIVTSNELGEYFDGRCEEYRDLKIILLQSQLPHDLMSQSSSRLINIDSKLG